jgi:hypothetical protein
MSDSTGGKTIRLSLLMVLNLAVGQMVVHADVLQSTVILPPPAGQYTVGMLCVQSGCIKNASVSDFVVVSSMESGGNQLEVVDALFSSAVYTNSGGVPGTFLGMVSVNGSMDITYFNRDPSSPLGTFKTQITSFDFKGTLDGNTLEVMQNINSSSTGSTTINEVLPPTSPVMYDVSSTLDINGELQLNGGPLVPAPSVTTTLTPAAAVPEPGYTALVGFMLVGCLGFSSRRRRNQ